MSKLIFLVVFSLVLAGCAGSPARQLLEGKSSLFDGTSTRPGFARYYGQDVNVLFSQQGYPQSFFNCTKNGVSRKIYVYRTYYYDYNDRYVGQDNNTIYYERSKQYTGNTTSTLVFADEYDNVESIREFSLLGGKSTFMKRYGCVEGK